jgi:S-adenosylmethionine:tRNA ribosyltransferase-isomerase
MLTLKDLNYSYPEDLVAQAPLRPSRVMWTEGHPTEISIDELIERIPTNDILVLNDTKVLKRRVYAESAEANSKTELEILFLQSEDQIHWDVLFPASRIKIGDSVELPLGISMQLLSKGRPQKVKTSRPLTDEDFEKIGEIPLPPYIQKARNQRHTQAEDEVWYQTSWAEKPGSLAAPTASLHFSQDHLKRLKERGVQIYYITLHVGLGTFLPVTTEILGEHKMHSEIVEISAGTWLAIQSARARGQKVWALGTTSARALESAAQGKLQSQKMENFSGFFGTTDLLILPPYEWKIVDRLLTNFHQPQSTLLAMVAAFADLAKVKSCYAWAVEQKFRLFSYGDLSVWLR